MWMFIPGKAERTVWAVFVGAALFSLWGVGCASPPRPQGPPTLAPSRAQTLRVAVPQALVPDALFVETQALVAALEAAGVGVARVDGDAMQVIEIVGDPGAFARWGATLEQVVEALRPIVPEPIFQARRLDPGRHTLELAFPERGRDGLRIDRRVVDAMGTVRVGSTVQVALRDIASFNLRPGSPQAREGGEPVLYIHLSSPPAPAMDDVIRQFLDTHRGVIVDPVRSGGRVSPR